MRRQDKKKYATAAKYCQVCGTFKVVHNHHIIHKADGGSDKGLNRVFLCPNCHSLVHKKKIIIKGWLDLGYKLKLDYEIVDETIRSYDSN